MAQQPGITARYLVWLMWVNGERLRHDAQGYRVMVGTEGTEFHPEHVESAMRAGAFAEVESRTPGERNWLLSDIGRQIAGRADREPIAAKGLGGESPSGGTIRNPAPDSSPSAVPSGTYRVNRICR